MCLENTLLWAIVPGSYSPAEPSWHTSTSPCCPAVEQTPRWTLGTGTLQPYAAAEQQVNSEDHLPGETWNHNKVTDRSASTWTRTVSSSNSHKLSQGKNWKLSQFTLVPGLLSDILGCGASVLVISSYKITWWHFPRWRTRNWRSQRRGMFRCDWRRFPSVTPQTVNAINKQ